MTSNHKLTAVLKGRTITGTQSQDKRLIVLFDDGSTMTVNTAGSTTSAATGGTIAEEGPTLLIQLAEATSSVMVRARDHTLEYAD